MFFNLPCSRVKAPTLVSKHGSSDLTFSKPNKRITSSLKSASQVTSSLQDGTAATNVLSPIKTLKCNLSNVSLICFGVKDVPNLPLILSTEDVIFFSTYSSA